MPAQLRRDLFLPTLGRHRPRVLLAVRHSKAAREPDEARWGHNGEFTLRALDAGHTRVQVRLDYDPDAVRETFGGPKVFAQSDAIAQTVRDDLERLKGLVER
ncbi:hypothetical protein GCM10022384_26870 [Streptomyces marokkonensis]|uniref:Polyketide cyclase / dehydrase and lipid transport n=1 Tax=Streptomyces marokkonensis TaxID=324855 RepID=A0ABP7Q518_9ACTN